MRILLILLISLTSFNTLFGQLQNQLPLEPNPSQVERFFTSSDTFNQKRFWLVMGTSTSAYAGVTLMLDRIWYQGYPRSKFHFYNDMGEWEDMDKVGHMYTAYIESMAAYKLFRWSGVDRKKAIYGSFGAGMLLQATIEVMDGFSKEWGWSWGDIAFNTAGALLYSGQELAWKEQRVVLKYSSRRRPVADYTVTSLDGQYSTTLQQRSDELFGTSFFEGLIKDYNSSTVWVSANIHSFLPNKKSSRFPKWLNVAVGHGAENLFDGYGKGWKDGKTGANYYISNPKYRPYRQIFLSVDVDLTKIPTQNKFLKSVFSLFNIFKIPAPTLEFGTNGKVKFHPIYF